ncbi:MAG TPA: hypothetical protein P5013_06380 [Methanoregula sp.]|nr:hypothetical protein [Methanoregula sp.]
MSPDDPRTGTCSSIHESDILRRLFTRPLFLSLTIGVPFCIFKLLFGFTLVRIGAGSSVLLYTGGWLVIGWALADLVMNLGRELFDIIDRPAPFEYCTIAQIGSFFSMTMVFLSLDTLLTFTIICTMLWSGWITTLSTDEKYLWYAATTLNLISLSIVVLYNEIRTLR